MMTDDEERREGQAGAPAKNSGKGARQERLKLALRENLKRRKSQARGRSDVPGAPSDDGDVSLDDGDNDKPNG